MMLMIDTKWIEAISPLDDSLRLALIDGIFSYLSVGEPLLSDDAMRIFCTLKPFIDEVRDKRIKAAERSRENGKKGGRKGKKNPTEPKEPTKIKYEECLLMDEYKERSNKLKDLDMWIKKHVPYIYSNFRPLTQREFECLHPKYSGEQICDTLLQIENRKDLRKKYTSLYRTLLNWIKRNYGNS